MQGGLGVSELETLLLSCALVVSFSILTACNRETERAAAMTGGDPQRGKIAVSRYGCATCHTIPGINGADALVGPPLNQMGSRSYIAGCCRTIQPT
jgi:cytochrome c2